MILYTLQKARCFLMRIERKNWHKTISEREPEAFDAAINAIIQSPDVKFYKPTHRGEGLIACIEYETEETFYENIKEEFEARGEIYYCDECPYLKPIEDRRHRYHECKCGTTTPSRKACLLFYQELAKGEIGGKR